MKRDLTHIYTGRFQTRTLLVICAVLFAFIASVGTLVFSQQVNAQTATQYCARFTSNTNLNACKAGFRGDDCSDFAITHDQSVAKICSDAATYKASPSFIDETAQSASPTPTTTTSSTNQETYRNNIVLSCSQYSGNSDLTTWCMYGGLGSSGNSEKPKTVAECLSNTAIASQPRAQGACVTGATAGQSYNAEKNGDTEGSANASTQGFQIQDILDQTQNLSDLIDVMHALGIDSDIITSNEPSNNRDSYVNGAGKQQKIVVHPCAEGTAQNAANSATGAANDVTNAFNQGVAAQQGYDQGFQAGLQAAQQTSSFANTQGSFNNQGVFNNFSNLNMFNTNTGNSNNAAATNFGEYNPFDVSSVNSIVDLFNIGPGAQPGYEAGYNQGLQNTNGLSGLTSLLGGLGGSGLSSNGLGGLTSLLGGLGGQQNGGAGGLGGLGGLLGGQSNTNNLTNAVSNMGVPGTGCPAILWTNGGGWHSNDGTAALLASGSANKNGDSNMAQHGPPPHGGANARGYTVIEITYRLGSSGVYYMLEDVLRGIQHVRNNAGLYGIDPSKIVIGGDSAGGSLAVRAASTGRTGAKAMVGWSPPTNAYTGLFRSYKSLFIGMDHSTCIPTDVAGLANFTDLLAGGSGEVAEYGQGLLSNDFSGIGINGTPTGGLDMGGIDPIGTITQVLLGAQYLADTGQNIEAISSQLQSGNPLSMSGSLINLSSKKLVECLDNFNSLSPALFASPDSPPGIFMGFDSDDVVGPEQVIGMRDKLRGLGLKSEGIVIPGDTGNVGGSAFSPTNNHAGYDPRFVCATINFIDEIIRPDKERPKCDENAPAPSSETPAAGDSGGGGGGGGGAGGPGSAVDNDTPAPTSNIGSPCSLDQTKQGTWSNTRNGVLVDPYCRNESVASYDLCKAYGCNAPAPAVSTKITNGSSNFTQQLNDAKAKCHGNYSSKLENGTTTIICR